MEQYTVYPENLDIVLLHLYSTQGYFHIDFDEFKEIFIESFLPDEDGNRSFNEEDIEKFFRIMNEKDVERAVSEMYKEGIVDISHDGTDFCYSLTEHGKKIAESLKKKTLDT